MGNNNLKCPQCGGTNNVLEGCEVYGGKTVEENMKCKNCGLEWSINPTTL